MKRLKYIGTFFIFTYVMVSSCTKDLDVTPLDERTIVSANLKDRPSALIQTLAKCYAAFALPGQSLGDADISGIDPGFGVYTRVLWNLQELPTDEAVNSWPASDALYYLHWQNWSSTDVHVNAMYSRIIYTVALCNEFIRNSAGNSDQEVIRYNSEARFLRALAYFHALDLFGNPTFITEKDLPGSFFPKQTTRKELFNFVESELKDIENKLGEPRFEYGRADKACAWMLLSRLYLNAEIYTGNQRYGDCVTYSEKVLNAGYLLEPNYRLNFSADNHTSREMIFAINYDGNNTRSYGGTTYIINSATGGSIKGPEMGVASGWSGNKTTKEFVHILVDTLVYPRDPSDPMFTKVKDQRVLLKLLTNWDIIDITVFTNGIGVRKFTNLKSDGTKVENAHNEFSNTDFPIFRLADAHLMHAEAILRSGGNRAAALADVNTIRTRAFGNASGNISDGQLTLDFILDERGRELYWECVRRTDLIRFDKFTTDKYLWSWKGQVKEGAATESYRNIYPIPAAEISSNPNIKQNAGY